MALGLLSRSGRAMRCRLRGHPYPGLIVRAGAWRNAMAWSRGLDPDRGWTPGSAASVDAPSQGKARHECSFETFPRAPRILHRLAVRAGRDDGVDRPTARVRRRVAGAAADPDRPPPALAGGAR